MQSPEPIAPGSSEWTTATIDIAGYPFRMKQISLGEALAADFEGGAEPFWAHVWPIGRALAAHVLAGPSLAGLSCLDLGTGSGIVGIALGLKGAHVTFADRSTESLALASENARHSGVPDFTLLQLDWTAPPPLRFDRVYAADVAYDHALVGALASSFRTLLAPGGVAYLADPRRPYLPVLLEAFTACGFTTTFLRDEPECVIVELRAPTA